MALSARRKVEVSRGRGSCTRARRCLSHVHSTSPLSFIHSMNHVNTLSPLARTWSSHIVTQPSSKQAHSLVLRSGVSEKFISESDEQLSTPISHPMVHISTNATHSHSAKISAGRNQRINRRQEGTHACREWFVLYRPSCVRVFRKSELRLKNSDCE